MTNIFDHLTILYVHSMEIQSQLEHVFTPMTVEAVVISFIFLTRQLSYFLVPNFDNKKERKKCQLR